MNKNLGKIKDTISEHGAPVIEQLLDKLTGKGAQVKYSFENLKVEMPAATKPNGDTVKGGRLNVNGTVTISAKVVEVRGNHEQNSSYDQSSSHSNYGDSNVKEIDPIQPTTNENLKDYSSDQTNPV